MTPLVRIPHWHYLSWARERFGIAFALGSYPTALAGRPVWVPIHGHLTRVAVRPGTADLNVYDAIFRDELYATPLRTAPRVIIDAGAHIGLSAVWFALRYPEAHIIAIEPAQSNYALLRTNTARFGERVHALHSALWSRRTSLKIANANAETWSFRTEEEIEGASEDGIQGLTVLELLRGSPTGRIDLLKMDIEGAEREVLGDADGWIDHINAMLVELHERHTPGCEAALDRAVKGRGFSQQQLGDCELLMR